nr:nucleoside-triphosphatase [uncultured Sphaerochaeta sp.]
MQARLTIHAAGRDQGKTTSLVQLVRQCRFQKMPICGVLALANPEKTVYRLKDLFSQEERLALAEQPIARGKRIGRFYLDEQAFDWINAQILQSLPISEVAIFDEIGKLEISGEGLATSFRKALETPSLQIYAAVRIPFIEEVLNSFSIPKERVEITYVGYKE